MSAEDTNRPKLLMVVHSLDYKSTIGAVPYFNQLLRALEKKTHLQVVESDSLPKGSLSLPKRALRKYLGVQYAVETKPLRRYVSFQPDYIIVVHDFTFLYSENLVFLRRIFPSSKIVFYDIELPLLYPSYSTDPRYGTSPYEKLDLAGVDGVIIPSKGAEKFVLDELKALRVKTVYFSVDSAAYPTEPLTQVYDICYLGMSTYYREDIIRELVSEPSRKLPEAKFLASSRNQFDFGNAEVIWGSITFDAYSRLPRQSKINLSITRKPFAETYASSISRLFELAAMKCCIVSNPCLGMEEWFSVGKEVLIAHDSQEAVELYSQLLDDSELRTKIAENAYERLLREHTTDRRAEEIVDFLQSLR